MKCNEKMREAIARGKEVPVLIDTDEARREARMQEEASMATRGKEKGQADHMWVDRMLHDIWDRRGGRPYTGKRNPKRKGTIRNKTEHAVLTRIDRKH